MFDARKNTVRDTLDILTISEARLDDCFLLIPFQVNGLSDKWVDRRYAIQIDTFFNQW